MSVRKLATVIVVLFVASAGYLALEWLGYLAPPRQSTPTSSSAEPVDYRVEEYVTNLEVPWSIVWTPVSSRSGVDGATRLLVAERGGAIRIVENGELAPQPLHVFPDVTADGEEGLMSLAVDPEYARNRYVYAVYARPKGDGFVNRVVKFRDAGNHVEEIMTLIDDIPSAQFHAGSRLRFGPDGKLYITTGDATDRDLAQNKDSLAGKILRINPDGTIPSDNPLPNDDKILRIVPR